VPLDRALLVVVIRSVEHNIAIYCIVAIYRYNIRNVIFYRYDMALAIFRKYDMHSRHIAIWQYIVDILSLERKGKRGEGGVRRAGLATCQNSSARFLP
jgi:hypothetical protein